jgi:DNA-binding NtrC family response regulator
MKIKLQEEAAATIEDSSRLPLCGPNLGKKEPAPDVRTPLRELRTEAEVHAISRALEYAGWNRRRAAELLCISYRGLLYKIRQYNITATKNNGSNGSKESSAAPRSTELVPPTPGSRIVSQKAMEE